MVAPLPPPQYPPPPEQLMPAGGGPAARGPVSISQQNSGPCTDHPANPVQTRKGRWDGEGWRKRLTTSERRKGQLDSW
eukprot:1677313-Rhodomonas_salina.1